MRKCFLLMTLLLAFSAGLQAQSYKLVFGDSVPEVAREVLQPRFSQMLEAGGLTLVPTDDAALADDAVEALQVDAVVTSRMETPGAMSQIALTIDLTASRGDVSETFPLKGVGATEDDAWLRAVKQFLPRSKAAMDFVSRLAD